MKIVSAKSTDGIIYRGLLTEAENAQGIIIHIHGMSGTPIQESYYQPMHEQYSQNGWSFLAGELRGTDCIKQFDSDHGTLTLGNTYELFEDCIHDIQGWINFAKDLGYKKIWLQSHSLGTSKTAYYINQVQPNEVEGLVLLSPADMVGLVNIPEDIEEHKILLEEAKNLVRDNKPKQILSQSFWEGLQLSAESYLSFFDDNAKDNIFKYLKPDEKWEVVESLNIPVIAVTGTNDDGIVPVVNAFEAMNILSKKLSNSPSFKTLILENAEHSFEGFEDEIIRNVLEFINS